MGKWIVCSAWPYVNTIPHLGTFIHLLSADVYSRYLKLKGEQVVSVTGSDEHGTPIELEAIRRGVSPKTITDKYHHAILTLLDKYDVKFDNYTRTENPVHIEVVQSIFKKIYDNGYVFPQEVTLPYCERCGRYLPDRFIEGECPQCHFEAAKGDQCDQCGSVLEPSDLIEPHCVFCGLKPTARKSKHWFFNLPKFADRLEDYLNSNPQLPENARNFSYRWLRDGLKPRAATRDNRWGIPAPFPGAEGKTIYVWLEAVLGYVSATVEWSRRGGSPEEWKRFWFDKNTKSVYFIGKDNIPFHTIIFPALLMASGDDYVLPWQVSSTEFILYESQKFSKSRRIGVWVDEALEIADAEYWRYVLMALRPEAKDANFTWRDFQSKVNIDLNDVLGNFVFRTLSFIKSRFDSKIPTRRPVSGLDREIIKLIEDSPRKVGGLMDKVRLRDAVSEIIGMARKGNQYLSANEPWHKLKIDPQSAETTLNLCGQLIHSISILLWPFMPRTADIIREQLNLKPVEEARWDDAGELRLMEGHRIGAVQPIFKKIKLEELMVKVDEAKRKKLEG